jgi:hypothetical protein
MDTLWQDIRYGLRMLLRAPGFTVVAIVALALGIGANTAIFSVVNGILLRPLPYKDPDRLVRIIQNTFEIPPTPVRTPVISSADFRAIRETSQTLIEVGAYDPHPNTGSLTQERLIMKLAGRDEPIPLIGAKVSPVLFPMLGAQPRLGRVFETHEENADANGVVILSHNAWQKYFQGDPGILGRTLSLDDLAYSVVGVMDEEHVLVADPSAGGDDFAYFGQNAPSCLFLVGSSNPAKGLDKGHHNSAFDIDEDALSIGAACLESIVRRLLTAT